MKGLLIFGQGELKEKPNMCIVGDSTILNSRRHCHKAQYFIQPLTAVLSTVSMQKHLLFILKVADICIYCLKARQYLCADLQWP